MTFVYAGKGLRFKPVRTGRWWNASSQNEIDIVATDGGDAHITGDNGEIRSVLQTRTGGSRTA